MIRLSREQVRRVDQICIDEYRLPGIVLMENAARSAADMMMISRMSREYESGLRVLVACGGGNNGGDGYAIARHLANRGHRVTILPLVPRERLTGDARTMADVAHAMALPIADEVRDQYDVVYDCLFGTGLARPPADAFATAIAAVNRLAALTIAIDVPSGLDCDTGEPLGDACIRADHTVTFVAEKLGFANPHSRAFTGVVAVGDIGCPREVIGRVARA